LKEVGFCGNALGFSRHYRVGQNSFLWNLVVSGEKEGLWSSRMSKWFSTKSYR